ncbi:hypothetical protein [Bacillus smithii]|uniref:hypothetical protein n=1 Tax=Bacillus smithii TaxID=1479 RepID=UPI002E200033|nr:hypothetical protein [Bacillus smithii]MED4928081.1 hypothetical protein [Bacillus smithii]
MEILLESGSLDTLIEGLAKFSERYFERIQNQTKTSVTVKMDEGIRSGLSVP